MSSALRPARAGLARPETEEGRNVMQKIYRPGHTDGAFTPGVNLPWR